MASNINPYNIDGTFPVAGQDNPSQGFRDNFTNIKNNFAFAQTEINDLQTKTIVTAALNGQTISNDMAGTQIVRPQLRAWTQAYYNLGVLNDITIARLDFNTASVYRCTTGNPISIVISNWPAVTGVGALGFGILKLWVTVTDPAHTITLPSTVTKGVADIAGYNPTTHTITVDSAGDYIFDFVCINYDNQTNTGDFLIMDLTRTRNTLRDDTQALGNISVAGLTTTDDINVVGQLTVNWLDSNSRPKAGAGILASTAGIYDIGQSSMPFANAYFSGNIVSGNITARSIETDHLNFANGVSLFDTIVAGKYGDANVATYLSSYTGTIPALSTLQNNVNSSLLLLTSQTSTWITANTFAANTAAGAAVSAVQGNLNSLSAQVNNFSTAINNVTSTVATLNSTITVLSANINIHTANIRTLNNLINAANVTTANLINQVTSSIIANIATVNSTITSANAASKLYTDTAINSVNQSVATAIAAAGQASTVSSWIAANVAAVNSTITTANTYNQTYTNTAVSTAVNNLIDSAPGTLATLGLIAANLATDANSITSIINSITSVGNDIAGANAAIIAANVALQSYVDTQDLNLSAWITANTNAANSAAFVSNLQITGYVDNINNQQTASLISANSAMANYVDNQITTVNTKIAQVQYNVDSANTAIITANTALLSYVDYHDGVLNNAITTANTALRSYVDNQITTVTTAWTANAATQESEIISLQSNITAANTRVDNLTVGLTTFSKITAANISSTTIYTNGFFYGNGTAYNFYTNQKVLAVLAGNIVTGNTNVIGTLSVNGRAINTNVGYFAQYIVSGAGGGAGSGAGIQSGPGNYPKSAGGAGGAGGALNGTMQLVPGNTYTITIGAGGAGGTSGANGVSGGSTSIFDPKTFANVYALGGGYGGGDISSVHNGGNGANPGAGFPGLPGVGGSAGAVGNTISLINSLSQTYTQAHNNPTLTIGDISVSTNNGGTGVAPTDSAIILASGSKVYTAGLAGSDGAVYITYCSSTQLGIGGTVRSYTQNGLTFWMHQFTSNGTYTYIA